MSTLAITASQGGRLSGYASLFGVVDFSGDKVEPGAFVKSIARRGADGVRMLWQHDPKEPIGRWTRIVEDRRGLLVEGELALSTQRGRDVHELLQARALDGLSIGFRATRSTRSPGGVRRLTEIDLWEISVVTFPMQPQARITIASVVSAPLRLAERLRAASLSLSTTAVPAR